MTLCPFKVDPTLLIPAHIAMAMNSGKDGRKGAGAGKKKNRGWLSSLKKVDKWVNRTSKKKAAAKAKTAGSDSPKTSPRSRSSTNATSSPYNPAEGSWKATERVRLNTIATGSTRKPPLGFRQLTSNGSGSNSRGSDDGDYQNNPDHEQVSYVNFTATETHSDGSDNGDGNANVDALYGPAIASTPSAARERWRGALTPFPRRVGGPHQPPRVNQKPKWMSHQCCRTHRRPHRHRHRCSQPCLLQRNRKPFVQLWQLRVGMQHQQEGAQVCASNVMGAAVRARKRAKVGDKDQGTSKETPSK